MSPRIFIIFLLISMASCRLDRLQKFRKFHKQRSDVPEVIASMRLAEGFANDRHKEVYWQKFRKSVGGNKDMKQIEGFYKNQFEKYYRRYLQSFLVRS